MKPLPAKVNAATKVLFIADTFVSGRHVTAGRVATVQPGDYSLLREANRIELFDPEDKAHVEAEAASKKLDAAEAADRAAAEKAADDKQSEAPGSSPAAIKAAENAKKNVAALTGKKSA